MVGSFFVARLYIIRTESGMTTGLRIWSYGHQIMPMVSALRIWSFGRGRLSTFMGIFTESYVARSGGLLSNEGENWVTDLLSIKSNLEVGIG